MDIYKKYQNELYAAAQAIQKADVLYIGAGAGMGVDSGMPDFRGPEGFWRAYPPYRHLNMHFEDAANPQHFIRDPELAWGFYGHRLNLYRSLVPHAGFQYILQWITSFKLPYFVYTSNVDGHFQKAGFPESQVYEIHGSIHHLQCLSPCHEGIWTNEEEIFVEPTTMRAQNFPICPRCEQLARPNVLMFGDWSWVSERTANQSKLFRQFEQVYPKNAHVVALEIGAGKAIPSVRQTCRRLTASNGTLIRINVRDADGGDIVLPLGGLEGLAAIHQTLGFSV